MYQGSIFRHRISSMLSPMGSTKHAESACGVPAFISSESWAKVKLCMTYKTSQPNIQAIARHQSALPPGNARATRHSISSGVSVGLPFRLSTNICALTPAFSEKEGFTFQAFLHHLSRDEKVKNLAAATPEKLRLRSLFRHKAPW